MIKMHDVLFGEFIEIEDNFGNLIIDCGCDNKRTFFSEKGIGFENFVKNYSSTYIEKKNSKRVMISHFHDDHINGFEYFPKRKFEKVYVPYISHNEEEGAFIFLEAMIAYIFGGHIIKKKTKAYLEQVTVCLNLSANGLKGICPIGIDDNYNYGNYNHEILWPPKVNMIEWYYCSKICKHFKLLKKTINKLRQYGSLGELLNLIDKIFDKYKKYLFIINTTDIQVEFNHNDFRIMLEKFYIEVNRIKPEILNSIKNNINEIRSIIRIINKDINSTSIVDLVKDNKNYKTILLTGDITRDIFDDYISDHVDRIYILKAPHHGTNKKKHYTNKLPKAEFLLISNGGFKRRKIVDNYAKKYHKIYCTHGKCLSGCNECEIFINNKSSCPKGCSCNRKEIII